MERGPCAACGWLDEEGMTETERMSVAGAYVRAGARTAGD